MTCPVCNKPYPCVHGRGSQPVSARDMVASGTRPLSSPAAEAFGRADRDQWRQEVVFRVRQHRARRRRYDPSTSLDLDFSSDAAMAFASDLTTSTPEFSQSSSEFPPRVSEPVFAEGADEAEEIFNLGETSFPAEDAADAFDIEPVRPSPRKIIRFPKYAPVEPVIVQRPAIEELELAEPAPEAPRILDAPESEFRQMDLLTSFADIRLEEAPAAVNLCDELESVPQPAPLTRRFASGALDSGIVLFAAGLFAATFVQIAENVPASRSVLLGTAGIGAILWLLFQYLFLVYGGSTPGMRATRLTLFSFSGKRPSRFARRVRALATTLSGFSVGVGYAWALVDEDTLGWHDRISQTYVKST